jgi:Nucleotidyltransferase domain
MNANTYLAKVLTSQTLGADSAELKALRERRAEVEQLLRDRFKDSSPTIRYGGSMVKGTMIREYYDLDLVCYFPHDDTAAGETLEDIYNNVRKALETKYLVESKTSALRLKDLNAQTRGVDFHIDVVPGRFTDDSKSDCYLYCSMGDKNRLKTNLDVHIAHVKESGVLDAIRLMKLWKVRNGLSIKTFVLELAVIDLLKGKTKLDLAAQLEHVWIELRDNFDDLPVEDPANPTGNDFSSILAGVKAEMESTAERTLRQIDATGWETVYGEVEASQEAEKTESLRRAAAAVVTPTKPWLPEE